MGKSRSVSRLAGLSGEAGKKLTIYDLDSSEFWPGGSEAGLPYYLCKIMEKVAMRDAIVLVSAHKLLRNVLFLLGVKYVSVRPPGDPKTKQLYLAREVSPPHSVETCSRYSQFCMRCVRARILDTELVLVHVHRQRDTLNDPRPKDCTR